MRAYRDADYRWEREGHWLPLVIGAPATDLESAFPGAGSFGLLSAWNPYSIERTEQDNRREDDALHAALRESGLPYRPGFSSARNRSWREPSWVVVDMPVAGFDALARRFGQLGTLYAHRGEPVRLRLYRSRPASAPDDGFVDWVE